MAVLTEGRHAAEFVMSEAAGSRSRDNVPLIDGNVVTPGMVLGIITASSKYTEFNQDAVDGSEAAAGIALYATTTSGADAEIAIIRRDAEVNGNLLTWPSDIDAGEKTAAEAELAALGIVVRY